MRVVFFGTPEFAVPSLTAVAREHEVVLAVAQPDKPSGRGMHMHAPPVAARARELAIDVAQPAKIRDPEFMERMRSIAPDAAVVVAYGKILPAALLAIPKHGFFNVHGSILPKYRGAAPIQRAIENGETETGVSIMRVDEELDHGPVLAIAKLAIDPDEHSPSLASRMSHLGAEALVPVLNAVAEGRAKETPQDHAAATLAPKIDKSEGVIRWTDSAQTIYNKFRAFDPWPGISFAGLKLIDLSGAQSRSAGPPAPVGTITEIARDTVTIATSDGAITLKRVQRAGKAPVTAAEHARAAGWRVGARL